MFGALTDADQLVRWFPSTAITDPHGGGSFAFTFVYGDDPDHPVEQRGEFLDVVPNKRVAFTWPVQDGTPTTVEFTITDLGGETEVALSHTGFGSGGQWDPNYERHVRYWTVFMSNIKSVLERGEDQRPVQLGQLVGRSGIEPAAHSPA